MGKKEITYICTAQNHITIAGKRYNLGDKVMFSQKELENENILRLVKRFFRPDVAKVESEPAKSIKEDDSLK